MRQLHPVSFHERFVASGTYVHYQADVATGDVERWTLHEPGDGAWTLRADYDGRAGSGASWLLEGFYDRAHRRFERFDLSLYGTRHVDAKFVFEPHEARVSLRSEETPSDGFVMALPPGYDPQPPALVGAYLFAVGPASDLPLLVPDLDFAGGRVHRATVTMSAVEPLGAETLTVDDEPLAAHVMRVRDDRGRDVTCWFDAHDILLRCRAADGRMAHLTQYVHRPETTS